MELMELSTQLKTFDIVDNQSTIQGDPDKKDGCVEENRRLTRSMCLPKSDVWAPVAEFSSQKNAKKVLDPEDEIKKIYLNNKVKLVHKNLETIFENPIVRKGNPMFLGIGKHKRSLYLCREFRTTTKQKSKIRKSKIKRLGKRVKPFKLTDDEFREKMMRIDNYINGDGNLENNELEKGDEMDYHTNSDTLGESNQEMQTS